MRRKTRALPLLLALFLLTVGCRPAAGPATPAPPASTPVPVTPTPTPEPDPVEEALSAMTTEEKVGQLLMAGFYGAQAGEEVRAYIQDLHVGGVILFGRNVESAGQLVELTNGLKALAGDGIPLLIAADQEGGSVDRMPPEVHRLPNPYDAAGPAALAGHWERSAPPSGSIPTLPPAWTSGPTRTTPSSAAGPSAPTRRRRRRAEPPAPPP